MSLENIATRLSEDDANKLAAQVVKDFESDDDSRRGWLDMHAGWLRLYYQMDKPLKQAWPGASDETLPLLAEACTQFHARAMSSLFPGRNIVTAIPTLKLDPMTEERAKRVGKHMSWQLMVKDRGYKTNKDTLLLGLALHGSYFTKTYYDPVKKKNCVENVGPEALVVPYGIGPRSIEDCERKTQIIWQTMNDVKILVAAGFYAAEPVEFNNGEKTKTQEAADKAQGVTEPVQLGLACILEQHFFYDLNNDGIGEPVIAWVCRQSRKLLRLAPRYETTSDPITGAEVPVSMEPVEYYTHYVYMPNPEGFYGLGMGHLIGPLNKACNKSIRQTIDANTLATIGNASGFMSDLLGVRGGEIQLELGKFPKINATVDDISKGIFQFKFPPPSPVAREIIALLMQRSDRLASVTELTTGQPEKVYQPTMGLALIEQAQQVYNAVYGRVLTAWESELRKYFNLNAKYLPDVQAFAAFGQDGSVAHDAVTRDDYAPDLMVIPIADPKQTSKEQKLMKAQAELQFIMTNPLTAQNPMAIYAEGKRYLEAMEVQNIDEIWPSPIPLPEPDPHKENAIALSIPDSTPAPGDKQDASPDKKGAPQQQQQAGPPPSPIPPPSPEQDHMGHILAHRALVKGEPGHEGFAQHLTPDGIRALQAHIQQHIAMLYEAAHGPRIVPQGFPGAMGPAGPMASGGVDGGIGPPQGSA